MRFNYLAISAPFLHVQINMNQTIMCILLGRYSLPFITSRLIACRLSLTQSQVLNFVGIQGLGQEISNDLCYY